MASRREEALHLSTELLAYIELSRLPAMDIARKAFRLARLLDDTEAMQWLHSRSPATRSRRDTFRHAEWAAAERSNRDDDQCCGHSQRNDDAARPASN
jgi:hypothetical protein